MKHNITDKTAIAAENELESYDAALHVSKGGHAHVASPPTSTERLQQSLHDAAFNLTQDLEIDKQQTTLYLAYGSNLSDEKLLGDRGIRPLSSINVMVPELRMTFDLQGLPYKEPCFANSALRHSPDEGQCSEPTTISGDAWDKPMIGVVYELTVADYARIIATEGAGTSYQDIVVDCYPFASSDPSQLVPMKPLTQLFKAHTLFAPIEASSARPSGYAQPSARYLQLITDGARQRNLPSEYTNYLARLKSYTTTTLRQRWGAVVYAKTVWPLALRLLELGKRVSDDKGRAPAWYKLLWTVFFKRGVWLMYDYVSKPLFGDGERTIDT